MNSQAVILIVDDDLFIRKLLESIFNDPHYTLHFARDGLETLTKAKKIVPDVILLDVMMPNMNGFEVCRRLRNDDVLAAVPVIMVTVLEDQKSRLEGIEAGADDFITKPFNAQLIKARVETIIRLNRYKRLLHERDKFNWVVSILPDGIVVLDDTFHLVLINPIMLTMLGAPDETSFIGQPISPFFAPDEGEHLSELWRKILSGESQIERAVGSLLNQEAEKVPVEIVAGQFIWDEKPSVLLTIRDLTDLKSAERAHKETELRHKTILDAMGDAIHVIDPDYRIVFMNSYFYKWLEDIGLEANAVEQKHLFDVFPFLSEDIKSEYEKVFNEGVTLTTEETNNLNDCEIITETIKIPIFEQDKITGVETIIRDITQRKTVENALHESEENFRVLAEKSPNMIFINRKGRILYVNEQCEYLMGYTRDEFYAPDFDFMNLIAPEDYELVRTNYVKQSHGEELPPNEYTLVTKNKNNLNGLITTRLIQFKGEQAILGIITDITAMKKTEEKLVESLREKELLLREIQHRVKNNLQVIMSLLRIQSRKVVDQNMKNMLKECQDRVMSLALVHDKLYQTKQSEMVSLDDYISTLAQRLHHSFGSNAERIKLEFDIDDTYLDVDKAIPVGLIINELLSNSFKYGFPTEKCDQGKISISLKKNDQDQFTLCIADNGVGFTYETAKDKTTSMGLQLVKMLACGQLKGSIEFINDHGSRCSITFSGEFQENNQEQGTDSKDSNA